MSDTKVTFSSMNAYLAARLAIKFPMLAPAIINHLRKAKPEHAISQIGTIGEKVKGMGLPALDYLKDQPSKAATENIARIGFWADDATGQALLLLQPRDFSDVLDLMRDIAIGKPAFTGHVLYLFSKVDGDKITQKMGEIGQHSGIGTAQIVFEFLQKRPGVVAASEMTELGVKFPELIHDVVKELKSRSDLDMSQNFGYIGRVLDFMAIPMIEELRHERSSYADDQILEIGRRVEGARADAISALLERKSYDHARAATQIYRNHPLEVNLTNILVMRDYAVAAKGGDPVVIDQHYTRPLIELVTTGMAGPSDLESRGELANMLQRAATIMGAEKPANDVGVFQPGAELAPRAE